MMNKNPNVIGRMFDRIAPSYDRLNTILSYGIDRRWRDLTVAALGLKHGDRVLDIATGTGDLAVRALDKGCTVVGIDLSRGMMAHACAKTATCRYLPVQANALSMPFPDASFDKAMVGFGIRNMDDLNTLFAETARVLAKGGLISILEFSLPTWQPFKFLYSIYLSYILPILGGFFSGDFDAYIYLRDSIQSFPAPVVMEGLMASKGLSVLESRPLLGGIAHLYVAQRRA